MKKCTHATETAGRFDLHSVSLSASATMSGVRLQVLLGALIVWALVITVRGEDVKSISLTESVPGPLSIPLNTPAGSGHSALQGDISWDSHSLRVNNIPEIRLSAGIHFSRLHPYQWDEALGAIRAGGCNAIQTCTSARAL